VAAVEPARLVRRSLSRRGGRLSVRLGAERLELRVDRVWSVAVGKAALAMAAGLHEVAPEVGGIAIAPAGGEPPCPAAARFRILPGEHPVPDVASFASTRALLAALRARPRKEAVLLLLSGGASSLLEAPARGLRRADLRSLGRWLLRSGLPIASANAIRKHASAVKGGGLLRQAAPRPIVTLALSDVPGDDLSVIGSGPAVPDPTTYADALAAWERARGADQGPTAVLRHLRAGAAGRRPETVSPGEPIARAARAAVIGSNRTALAGARREARRRGFRVLGPVLRLGGEARECAARLVARLPARPSEPVCVLGGGETTVAIPARAGRGGRSQELALAAALALPPGWALLAAGTDGVDGPTPAAGAFADAGVRRVGLRALRRALDAHDAYGLLAPRGHVLRTGPTGTNVMDLVIAIHPGR